MSQIISVVPNVCEGRDEAFVEKVQEKLEAVPGLVVLDVSMDQVRNRTIFSFTGRKESVFEGGFLLYEAALGQIDMRKHEGEYPRIGAVDVFPFVALRDAPISTAVDWSVQFAEEVARRFDLPVYLFAESARTKLRRDIENIREGEYEGFAAKMTDPAWKPDFGPDVFPPDKGATIIGARLPIVNFKAYLGTPSEEAADRVASVLSDPATGFSGVHFYPALDRTRNEALLNITVGNFQATPLYRVLEAVKTELRRFGARVTRVEMVGLVPQQALISSAEHYLQIFDFAVEDVVENRLDAILSGRE
ncbi:MAG: glutamate formimidoyltransferase [Thermoanaerobaculia bacterium]|nr:glutamate formimidoyltransferase [Thermoanaerobaculia bacterium]